MHSVRTIVMASGVAVLLGAGCGSQPDAGKELERASAVMAKAEAEPAPAAPPPSVGQPPPHYPAAPPPAPPPAQEMNLAVAAYKSGQMEDAITRLQRLRATPALTPQQRMALNDAMAAVMTEVYTLAAKGDPRAIQAVKQYERMQAGQR